MCVISAVAQRYSDVVFLKNGSVIRGTITEQIPNSSLKIVTSDGSVLHCELDDVEKISKEPTKSNFNKRNNGSASGYRSYINAGYTVSTNNMVSEDHIDLATVHGYHLNPFLFAGVGVGATYFYNSNVWLLPVFAEVRGILPTSGLVKPYIGLRIGASIGLSRQTYIDEYGDYYEFGYGSGLYLTPSLGLEISRFDISASYVLQQHYSINIGGGIQFRIGVRLGK